KENVGCARPDIQEQRAVVDGRAAIAKRIVEDHGRHIDSGRLQPSCFHGAVTVTEKFVLNRDQYSWIFFVQPASDYLIIPNHVVDRERNILLRLERDDFFQLFVFKGWQFNKTRKDRLGG